MLWSSLCGFPFDHKSRSCMQEGSKTILLHYIFQRWISRQPSNNQALHGYRFIKMNSSGNQMCISLKRSHPILTVSATLFISTDVSNNGGYLSRYVQSTKYLVLARLHPWSCPSSHLLYNDRSFLDLRQLVPSLTEAMSYLVFCALTKSWFRVFHQYLSITTFFLHLPLQIFYTD